MMNYIRINKSYIVITLTCFVIYFLVQLYKNHLITELEDIKYVVKNEKFVNNSYKSFLEKKVQTSKIKKIQNADQLKKYIVKTANKSKLTIKNIKLHHEQIVIQVVLSIESQNEIDILSFCKKIDKKLITSIRYIKIEKTNEKIQNKLHTTIDLRIILFRN